MPTFSPEFHKITYSCDACRKTGRLDRHHIGREYLFIAILKKTKTAKRKWYKKFKKRYYEFRPYDIRRLCRKCHKEIHEYYNEVLYEHNFYKKWKRIENYSVEEVKELVKIFRATYFEWRELKRKES